MSSSVTEAGKNPRRAGSPLPILVYKEAEDIANNQRKVEAAFAVLFEETMKRRREFGTDYEPKMPIDN